MAHKIIQIYRGSLAAMPQLAVGELGWAADAKRLYAGHASGNQLVGDAALWARLDAIEYGLDHLDVSSQLAETLQEANSYTDTQVAYMQNRNKTFVGFVSAAEPSGAFATEGTLWYQSSIMPEAADFPIQVKTLTGGAWSGTTSDYSPNQLDLWLNNNNGLLYIWQNGEFRLEDTITDEDTTSLTPEGMIQAIDVASRTITAAAVSGNPNASSAADAPDDYFPPSVTGKYSQIIKWIIDKINVLRNRTLNGNGVVIMNGTAVTYSSLATLLSELPNL